MDWAKRLGDAADEAVLFAAGPGEAAKAEAAARSRDFFVARLGPAADKAALLAALARELKFPPYFGGNWDALLDALRDLDASAPASGWLIVAAPGPEERDVLAEVVRGAARFWAAQAPPRALKLLLTSAEPRL